MKTLKLVLFATIVVFAMVSVSNADGFKSKPKPVKVISISLEKAVLTPGLSHAICAQLSQDQVLSGSQLVMTVSVTYNGTLFRISGTKAQWLNFYNNSCGNDEPIKNDHEVVFGIG